MLETALLKVGVLGIAQFDSGVGTPQPALVVELVVVGAVNLRA